jgi:septation ring formation regulator EzrA
VALTLMIRDYARQKLAEIDATLRRYEEKYGMPFEAYKQIWDTEDREEHYAHQAEWDYLEWEALVTRRKRLMGSLCQRIANE